MWIKFYVGGLAAGALALLLASPVHAQEELDDVTMDVIEEDEVPADAVQRRIELPETASEQGHESSQHGLDTANEARERGRAFGRERAEQAREQREGLGRDLGRDRAEEAREGIGGDGAPGRRGPPGDRGNQ